MNLIQKLLSTLFFSLCTTLVAQTGIAQATAYRKNSTYQWNQAMKGLKEFELHTTDHVLDVGCGDGKITAVIADKVPQGVAIGLDVSLQMITEASSECIKENLFFLQGTAEDIPFEEYFDKIVSFSALHWVLDQNKALESMKKALKPEGTLLFIIPVKSANNVCMLGEKIAGSSKWKSYFPSFKKDRIYYTPEEYTTMLQASGLKLLSLEVFQACGNYKDKEAFIEWIAPLATFIDHLPLSLQREFLEELADEMLLVCPQNSESSITMPFYSMQIIAKK